MIVTDMEVEDVIAIRLEAIEVILNHILYVRGIYPPQVFKKLRVYNTPVFIVAFPALNSYLTNVMKTVQHLLKNTNQQLTIELIVYTTESEYMESYYLQMQDVQMNHETDQYLIKCEHQLSSVLYKFAERVKSLPKLGQNVKFKVHLHTTQTAFTHFSNIPEYQEFPWLQALASASNPRKFSLLPLARLDKIGLEMNVHIYN